MKSILAALVLASCTSPAWSLNIAIYHTSDVHGWYSSRPAKWDKENSTRTIGGFPALAALVEADKTPHILLDSGDTFQGTPEGNLSKGMATVDLMNQLGYSASAVGNHDYDYTEPNLRAMAAVSTFTWLGANVYVRKTGLTPDYLKPYRLIDIAGKRIAVIGVSGRHTATSTLPANVKQLVFRSEADEAARWTRAVAKFKPDAIIILAHIGLSGSLGGQKLDVSTWTFTGADAEYGTLSIARAAKGATVVIGGHNHTGLLHGYLDKDSGVLLAESYYGLTDVSRINLEFDDATGRLKGVSDELIPLWTDKTGEDPAVAATIKVFSDRVEKEMGKVISKSAVDLGRSTTDLDSDIGNWFTDAMRRQAGADAAFQNTAGIRAEIKKGPLALRDIFQVMPFENTLVRLTMTGDQVKRMLADNLRGGHAKMQLSGLTVKFREPPQGPMEITLERSGKPVKPEDRLIVVTNNYLTTGGSGGKVFGEAEKSQDTMTPIRELLIKDVEEHPVTEVPAGGRIVRLE